MIRLVLYVSMAAMVVSSVTITGQIMCKETSIGGAKLFLRTMQGKSRSELQIDATTDVEGKFTVEVPERDLDLFKAPKATRHLDYENSCAKAAEKLKPGCVMISTQAIPKVDKDAIDLGQIAAFMARPSPVCTKPDKKP